MGRIVTSPRRQYNLEDQRPLNHSVVVMPCPNDAVQTAGDRYQNVVCKRSGIPVVDFNRIISRGATCQYVHSCLIKCANLGYSVLHFVILLPMPHCVNHTSNARYQVVSPKYTGSLSKAGCPRFPFPDRKSIVINPSLTMGSSFRPIQVVAFFIGIHPLFE